MGEKQKEEGQRVVVTDIRMPFWSMVVFMIKWVFASIPAMIVLSLVMTILMLGAAALTGSVWNMRGMFEHGGPSFRADLSGNLNVLML
jgi:hypothetical protein